MCDVRTATVITFIFRISARPFPLRLHILQQGRGCFFCFYFFFSSLKLSKFCLSFTPNAAPAQSLKITYHRDSPFRSPCMGSASFLYFCQRREDDSLWTERPSAVWDKEEDEESRFWPVPVCHRLALLQRFLPLDFIHLIESAGVWPPQSIFSMPACLQLVGLDRRLLIFLHGVRVRHEPFSCGCTVKLKLTLEKHFQWISGLSSAHNLMSTKIKPFTSYPSPQGRQ